MSTRNLPGGKARPTRKADNLTAICEAIVYIMREPRRLVTIYTSTESYKDSFRLLCFLLHVFQFLKIKSLFVKDQRLIVYRYVCYGICYNQSWYWSWFQVKRDLWKVTLNRYCIVHICWELSAEKSESLSACWCSIKFSIFSTRTCIYFSQNFSCYWG
jgi:hypothetical protein